MYLSGVINRAVEASKAVGLGYMVQPGMGNRVPNDGRPVAIDNGCFNARFSSRRWRMFLRNNQHLKGRVKFIVVPDVLGDYQATLVRWRAYQPIAARYGFPLAFVAQDGVTPADVPWDECACLFIGGRDAWKYGPGGRFTEAVENLIATAKRLGKWIHAGRVNSGRRFAMCRAAGVDSVDGTYLAFGPDVNLPKLEGWLAA